MSTKMFRDLPAVPVLEEVLAPLFNGFVDAQTALADAWPRPVSPVLHAAIGHALAFSTWRSLACEHGLRDETAVDLLTAMVVATTRWDVHAAA